MVVRDAAEFLPAYLQKITEVLQPAFKDYEIIVVDDGSKDATLKTIETAQTRFSNIQLYSLSPKAGIAVATIAGLDNAIGDYVITLDPTRDPAEKILEMVGKALEGNDIVYGVDAKRTQSASLYDKGALAYYQLFSRLTGLEIPREVSSFRLLSRSVVNYITAINDRHHLLSVLPAITGHRYATIEYTSHTQGSESLKPGFAAKLLEGISVLFACSVKPLRFATYTALAAGFLNLIYAVYVVIVALIKPDVAEGWVSLSLQSSGMFFLISLVLTIVSEYLYAIMERTQNRPLYHIARESSSMVFKRKEELNVVEGSRF
jgi:glycosyltransferase involved in cell wall biosynthesis